MIGADTLGLANTAGVEAKFYPVIPPVQRMHQEGVVDTILVAYDEPETGEMIPVGRVITSPITLTDNSGGPKLATSLVRGLVGDGLIYKRHNEIHGSAFQQEQAEALVDKQEAAAAMVLGHFGYDVKRKRTANVFASLLRKIR
ncbi:hypothetical protein KY385_00450 [Candidatus Parcubacteria bacterium]|nr:hypothetical protein [Candidatus Parcubacteria bacterium]